MDDHQHDFKVVKQSVFAATSKGVLAYHLDTECSCGATRGEPKVTPYGKKEYDKNRWLISNRK